MAPQKRTRDENDIDGDEGIEIESASSSFRRNTQKRTRVSLARETGSVISDDEDPGRRDFDDLLNDEYEDADLEHSLMQEYGNLETERDEIDEVLATQVVEKQYRTIKENVASDSGIIEEVFCRNFMCHSKLRIKIGPLINFIIGHNGSGKSAVLTALTMCLGGKAMQTNRGASLKTLIKEGQETATLAVKVKNQGEDAYRPNEYGASITVERHFSRSGTSGFKIKNAAGKTISSRKSDLDDILDYFGMQLDNPINVLTQDLARQFLSNSTATEKYKFFLRGTQLETLHSDYKIFEDHLDNMEDRLRLRVGDIDILKAKADEADGRRKQLENAQSIRNRYTETERKFAWRQVEEQEDILQRYSNDVEGAEESVRATGETFRGIDATFEAHNQALQAAQRGVEEHEQQLIPVSENHAARKEAFDNNKSALLKLKTEHRTIRDSMKKAQRDITRLEAEVAEEQKRLTSVEGEAHAERLAERDDLRRQVEEAQQAQKDHQHGLGELEQKRTDTAREEQNARPALDDAQTSVETAQGMLNRLQREQGNVLAGYHNKMQDLIRLIDRETRWRSKPIGPIGSKIQLLKPEWSSILETTFGGVLESFIVTCRDDSIVLSQLAKRVSINVPVYIGRPTRLDTTGKEPDDPNVDTILRVLRIDDDLVRNTLIINQAIEQTVLIQNHDEAYHFAYKNGRPHNVRAVLSFGNARGSGSRWEYTRTGAQKLSPVRPWGRAPRMQTDPEERLRIQRENLEHARRQVDIEEQKIRHLQEAANEARQAVEAHRREQKKLKDKTQNVEDALEAKENEIEANRPQDGKLQELERELEEARTDLRAARDAFTDAEGQQSELNETARELKTAMDEAYAQLEEIQDRKRKAEEKVQRCEQSRRKSLYDKNEADDNVKQAKAEVARLEEKRDGQQATLDGFIRGAQRVSERVNCDPNISSAALDERLTLLKEQYHREEARAGGSKEELAAVWAKAANEYTEAKDQMESLLDLAKLFKKTLAERYRRWGLFRKYISMRARVSFQYLLSERNFRGRALLDHQARTLDIAVEPDMSKQSDSGRQAKTLSGGEKSFSTICLLLSIWEAMGSPVRCLDEFDVFMDSVNRAQSMSMMIQAARRAVSRQFILITPQSMNNVDVGDDVKIHKMTDPERGQQPLPFGE